MNKKDVVYRGRCPWDQACKACYLVLTDGEVYQCPFYPERCVRATNKTTKSNDPYTEIEQLFRWQVTE